MLTTEQRYEFENRGYVRLHGLLQEDELQDMRSRTWALLADRGINRNMASWPAGDISKLQAVRSGDIAPHQHPALAGVLDGVFGAAGWMPKENWGQALITFPVAGPWKPAAGPWHLDHSYSSNGLITGVNVFLFVDKVSAQGGGTLIIESSPKILDRFIKGNPQYHGVKHGALNKLVMQADPWLKELMKTGQSGDEFRIGAMDSRTEVLGCSAKLTELTGHPGDVVLETVTLSV